MAEKVSVVLIDYSELTGTPTPEMMEKIKAAYGYEGLGILAITGVPEFAKKRAACLPKSYEFGNLPVETKAKYEHPGSFYSFGWSHGKEKLEGKFDYAKGSFYANPVHDKPVEDAETIEKFAAFCHPNIWPSEEDCAGFENAFKDLSRLIVGVGAKLAVHCDAYVRSQLPGFSGPQAELASIVENSRTHKGRLLYYFATDSKFNNKAEAEAHHAAAAEHNKGSDDVSSWCGWHNDHGSLTGLTPAMFFDAEGKEVPCPDPSAGLYIRSRDGKSVKAVVPADAIAFQIGETAQIHSGGLLQATPHCVKAADVPGVSRGTLAVFMEPEWNWEMKAPAGCDKSQILKGAITELLPRGVPQLGDRWAGDEQDFNDFTTKTLAAYY